MSNRQARREQSRTRPSRGQRTQRPSRAAPGRAPKRPGGGPDLLSRPYLIGVSVVIVVLAAILVFIASRGGESDSELVKKLKDAREALPLELASGAKLGKDEAPIKLAVFEDIQCPFCLKYTANQEPTLVEEYVKSGKMQITYNHLTLLGTESLRGALAMQCAADQNKFWEYHNKVFLVEAEAGQATTEKVDVGRFSDDKLKQYASDLGLDRTKFDECFNTDKYLQDIQNSRRTASSLGLNGTPSFVINGTPLGQGAPDSLDGWRKLLDDAYTQLTSSPTPAATTPGAGSPTASPATSPQATGTAPQPTATKAP